MQTRQVLNLALSLMLGGSLLAACGPAANAPTRPGANGIRPSATAPASAKPGTPAQASGSSSAELSTELQAVAADDAAFADTTTAADSGFSTQAIGIPQATGDGMVSATGMLGGGDGSRLQARVALNAQTRLRATTRARARAEMAKQKKGALEASGALTVNADGTITVDPAKLKAYVKANSETRRARFKERVAKIKAKLETRKEIAKDRLDKLRRKGNVVRSSEVDSTTNADGSITKTVSVEFKNEKTGVTRTSTSSRTSLNGKLVSASYELTVTGPNGYLRTVNRDVTVAADGTRTATTEASTQWGDGRKHERSETRVANADGSATGSGVITITKKDGTTKTFDFSVGIDADGNETVTGDDDADSGADTAEETVEVTVEDSADSTEVTLIIEEDGEAATEETVEEAEDADITIEVETEAAAS